MMSGIEFWRETRFGLEAFVEQEQMGFNNWKSRAQELKNEAYALYLCSRHPRTPLHAKLLALLIVGYAMSPIDLIPDFIPVVGYADDLVLIPLGIALLKRMIPDDVMEECRSRARSLPGGRPIGWVGVIIIICIWAAVIYIAYRLINRSF